MATLEFKTDANGNRRLADERFDGVTFPDPKRNRAHYDEAIREMEILHKAGVSFG